MAGFTDDETKQIDETYAVPAAGAPLFQAATASDWREVAETALDFVRRFSPT